MESIGIDVHKGESQVCIITPAGEVLERRVATRRERFAEVLAERTRARVLIEASTESEWVARCLAGILYAMMRDGTTYNPTPARRPVASPTPAAAA